MQEILEHWLDYIRTLCSAVKTIKIIGDKSLSKRDFTRVIKTSLTYLG